MRCVCLDYSEIYVLFCFLRMPAQTSGLQWQPTLISKVKTKFFLEIFLPFISALTPLKETKGVLFYYAEVPQYFRLKSHFVNMNKIQTAITENRMQKSFWLCTCGLFLQAKQHARPAWWNRGLDGGSAANNNPFHSHMHRKHILRHTLWPIWVYPSVE